MFSIFDCLIKKLEEKQGPQPLRLASVWPHFNIRVHRSLITT